MMQILEAAVTDAVIRFLPPVWKIWVVFLTPGSWLRSQVVGIWEWVLLSLPLKQVKSIIEFFFLFPKHGLSYPLSHYLYSPNVFQILKLQSTPRPPPGRPFMTSHLCVGTGDRTV